MSQLSIQTDEQFYRSRITQFAQITGRSLASVMRENVAILAGQLARRFPPTKIGEGKRAIVNDLNRIIIRSSDVRATREMNTGHVMVVFKDDKVIRIPQERYKPSASTSEIKAFHDSQRLSFRQRTKPSRLGRGKLNNRRVDGWTQSEKMLVPNAAANSYIRTLQQSVGAVKAKWTKATEMYRGASRLPAWITKHPDKGQVIDQMKDNGDGSITIVNDIPYASEWQDINRHVISRQHKFFMARLRGELRKQANEHNRRSA